MKEPKPRITTAVLILLGRNPMAADEMARCINHEEEFSRLRGRWGKVKTDQVYAAMSSLRSKGRVERNFIQPLNGRVGKNMVYSLTGYGEKRLRELNAKPKTCGDVAPALAAHVLASAPAAKPLDETLVEGWCYVLMYQPPCGRWYAHSHKLYNCPSDARDAARRFLHPDTPIAVVPVPANPPAETIR